MEFYLQELAKGPGVGPDPVSDLLDRSHRAHALYVEHVPHMVVVTGQSSPVMQKGDAGEARRWLEEAAQTRVTAQLIDPAYTDPAWRAEAAQFPHEELLQFYRQQLSS